MKAKRIIGVALAGAALVGCNGDIQNEYCQYAASLSYDSSVNPLEPLQAAINGSGTFALLSMPDGVAGKYYVLKAQLYGGEETSVRVNTSTATRTLPTMGLENASGFIIGNSPLQDDNPYVFDRLCPNCYAETRTTTCRLKFDNASTVSCSRCQRSYSLYSDGVVSAGESGKKLFRYRVTKTAGGISIHNP